MATITPLPSRAIKPPRKRTALERSLRRSQLGLVGLMAVITWMATHTEDIWTRFALTLALMECLWLTATQFQQSPMMKVHGRTQRGARRAWRWLLSRLPPLPAIHADTLPMRPPPSRPALESTLRELLAVLRQAMDAEDMTPLENMSLHEMSLELLETYWPGPTAHVIESIAGWPRVAVLSEHDELLQLMNRLPDGRLFDARGPIHKDDLGAWLGVDRWRIETPQGRQHAWRMDLDDCDLIAACLSWLPGDPLAAHQHRINAWFSGGAANDPDFARG